MAPSRRVLGQRARGRLGGPWHARHALPAGYWPRRRRHKRLWPCIMHIRSAA